MPALKISHLSKVFRSGFIPKKTVALQDISFEVENGEIFGLLGPNGAGKTTAIKCILSLVKPDSGTIELLGDPIPSTKANARIGFLSENPYVYEFLTGYEYLVFSAKLHGYDNATAKQKAREWLEFFQLEDASRRQLRKYSKGMLQKIGLAQALLNDPEFLILDEPMSGLDPLGRKEVRDLLFSLKSKGRTILFSSHILSDAEMICDRVGILVKGRIETVGKLQEFIRKVESYEITISNPTNFSPNGIRCEIMARSNTLILLKVPSVQEIDQVIALSKKQSFDIEAIIPIRRTLEELYLKQLK